MTWCARASSTPTQYLFSLGSWKKIYFGHSFKKVNHPGLLPQQGCVLLYKFEKSWALLGRLSRGFFTISGASNFKHIKRLFMTLSGLGLPTNVRDFWLSLLFLYLAFFSCFHCTKNWIYTKFTQCKLGAKKCKLRLNKGQRW